MKIFLTLDYELYGDGSGNVFDNVIEPMELLLQIAEELNVKYTIFFEFLEYLKLKEQWKLGNKMGYLTDPSEAMADQIKKAYSKGHDVQLHVHPQWLNSKFENNCWCVDNSKWRLGSLSQQELFSVLKSGKELLESMLNPINPEYRCIALRAGGYNCQPSRSILEAMKQVGLSIDSSIFAGGYEDGLLSRYDFSQIPTSIDFWECGDSLETYGDSGIYECPITSYSVIRIKKYFSLQRMTSFLKNRSSAVASFKSKTTEGSSLMKRIRYFFSDEYITWDFCLFSESMSQLFYEKAKSENKKMCVLVGHPKGVSSLKTITFIIKFLKSKKCSFGVLSDTADLVICT